MVPTTVLRSSLAQSVHCGAGCGRAGFDDARVEGCAGAVESQRHGLNGRLPVRARGRLARESVARSRFAREGRYLMAQLAGAGDAIASILGEQAPDELQ